MSLRGITDEAISGGCRAEFTLSAADVLAMTSLNTINSKATQYYFIKMFSNHSHKGQRRSFDATTGYHSYMHEAYTPPLQVISSGFSLWFDGHGYTRSCSEIFGVEMVTAGELELIQDGRTYRVGKGHVFFLRKGVPHIYRAGPAGFLRKRYIVIEGLLLEPVLRATGLDGCDVLILDDPVHIERLFRAINRQLQTKPEQFSQHLSTLGYTLLDELGKCRSKQHPQPIQRAIDFMERNLHRTVAVSEVCMQSGLSITHFNRLFKSCLNLSPIQFFINQRMAWARHLLLHSTTSIKEISSRLGYENPLYFSAQFKKTTGISPKGYREQGKNEVL